MTSVSTILIWRNPSKTNFLYYAARRQSTSIHAPVDLKSSFFATYVQSVSRCAKAFVVVRTHAEIYWCRRIYIRIALGAALDIRINVTTMDRICFRDHRLGTEEIMNEISVRILLAARTASNSYPLSTFVRYPFGRGTECRKGGVPTNRTFTSLECNTSVALLSRC